MSQIDPLTGTSHEDQGAGAATPLVDFESKASDEAVIDEADEATDDEGTQSADGAVLYRVMTVGSVVFDLGDASPVVHLMEAELPYRNIAIPVALHDAQSLHNALSGIAGRRPNTHELTSAILRDFQADIIAARIVRYEHGIFYAELDVMTPKGRSLFDCRTSDALVLAMRQLVPAPILCAEEVLSAC